MDTATAAAKTLQDTLAGTTAHVAKTMHGTVASLGQAAQEKAAASRAQAEGTYDEYKTRAMAAGAAWKVTQAVQDTKHRAADAAMHAKDATVATVMDRTFHVTVASAAAGAIAVGSGGLAAGIVAGATVGAALGLVPALFTFGLSIPIGAAIGGACGAAAGVAAGGTAGAVGGGSLGYAYQKRHTIGHVLNQAKAKVGLGHKEAPPPSTMGRLQEVAHTAAGKVQEGAQIAAEKAKEVAQAALHTAKDATQSAMESAKEAATTTTQAVQDTSKIAVHPPEDAVQEMRETQGEGDVGAGERRDAKKVVGESEARQG